MDSLNPAFTFISSCLLFSFGGNILLRLYLRYREEKRKTILILFDYIGAIVIEIFFLLLSLNVFNQNSSELYIILVITALEFEIIALYCLNKVTLTLERLEKNVVTNGRTKFIFAISMAFVVNPLNRWDSLHWENHHGFPFQAVSYIILIILTLNYVNNSYNRCKFIIDQIAEPSLKESYLWIKRGIQVLFLLPLTLSINFFLYIAYIGDLEKFLFHFYILSSIFGILILFASVYSFYIGITLPRWFLGRLYSKYEPMWTDDQKKFEDSEENIKYINNSLKKLYDAFID